MLVSGLGKVVHLGRFASRSSGLVTASIAASLCYIQGPRRSVIARCATLTTNAADVQQHAQPKIMVYQYAICPFCHKLRAVLDFFKVPYDVTEVNPSSKEELSFTNGYKKVPVAKINDAVVVDSPVILEALREVLPASAGSDFFADDAIKWAVWADTKLAVLLFPNITSTFKDSWEAFSYITSVPHFSAYAKFSNRVLGPVAMFLANSKIKKKYNITDEKAALHEALEQWLTRLHQWYADMESAVGKSQMQKWL